MGDMGVALFIIITQDCGAGSAPLKIRIPPGLGH